jgi:hypothetical protein
MPRSHVLVWVALLTTMGSPILSQQYVLKPEHPIPSFTCGVSGLTPLERAICSNDTLADLDSQLASVFGVQKDRLSTAAVALLVQSQRQWIKQRDQCVHYECVVAMYRARIEALTTGGAAEGIAPESSGPTSVVAANPPKLDKSAIPSLISGTWGATIGPGTGQSVFTRTSLGEYCPDKYKVLSVFPPSSNEPEYYTAILADHVACSDGYQRTDFLAVELIPDEVKIHRIFGMGIIGCPDLDEPLDDLRSVLYGNSALHCTSRFLSRITK